MATRFPQQQTQIETQNPLRLAENYRQNMLNQQKMGMFQQEMQQKNTMQQQAKQQADRQHRLKTYKLGIDSGNADFLKELWKREFPDEEPLNVKISGGNFETIFESQDGKQVQMKGTLEDVGTYEQFLIDNPQLKPQEVLNAATQHKVSITEYSDDVGLEPGRETTEDRYVKDEEAKYRLENPDMSKKELAKEIAKKRPEWRLEHKRAQAPEVRGVTKAKRDVIVDTAADIKEREETGKGIAQTNLKQFDQATAAIDSIAKIGELMDQIEASDIATGFGAEMIRQYERIKARLGSDAAVGKVAGIEILDVMMGSEVFPMIKALGVGARGMDTPAEREFMRKVLTGSIELNKATLQRMAEIRQNVSVRTIIKWNKRIKSGALDTFFESTGEPKQLKELPPKFITLVNPETGKEEVWNEKTEKKVSR